MNHKSQNVLFLTSHKFRLQLRLQQLPDYKHLKGTDETDCLEKLKYATIFQATKVLINENFLFS